MTSIKWSIKWTSYPWPGIVVKTITTHIESQLLQKMRHTARIGNLVSWTRVNHHCKMQIASIYCIVNRTKNLLTSNSAKLSESLFRCHTQSIAQRSDLRVIVVGTHCGECHRRHIVQRFIQRRLWRDNFLRWHIHGRSMATGTAITCC